MVDIEYTHPGHRKERIRESFRTRKAAEKREREIMNALEIGNWKKEAEQEVPTFKEFGDEFVENYAVANNKPSEVDSKRMILRVHLMPVFGKLRLNKISPRQIERYKAQKRAQQLSPATINNHLGVLSKLFAVAEEWGIISHVPRIKRMKEGEQEFDFADFEEAERLLTACREVEPELYALLHTVQKTGMRSGEFLELRWQDVDLVTGTLTIRRSYVRRRMGTPKNHKSRTIELGDDAIGVLKTHRHLKSELVFCDPKGKIMTKDMLKRPLKRICIKAGLRHLTWRDMRHTFASHLVMRGAPLKTVQELMGHADIKTTMRYAHLSPSVRRDAAKLLDRRFFRGTIAAPSEPQNHNQL